MNSSRFKDMLMEIGYKNSTKMTLTKLYYLAEGMEFTLIAEMDGYAHDEMWIDSVTWNKAEHSDAENDAIALFMVKHKDGIDRDFFDLADLERKDAEDNT